MWILPWKKYNADHGYKCMKSYPSENMNTSDIKGLSTLKVIDVSYLHSVN